MEVFRRKINTLLNGITNNTLLNGINTLFIYMFLIIIIYHIVQITTFVYKYNESFDYGRALRYLCNLEYFEYETPRFQIAVNKDKIAFSQKENYKYYMLLVLISGIIFSVIAWMIFIWVLHKAFFNTNYYKTKHGLNNENSNVFTDYPKIFYKSMSFSFEFTYVFLFMMIMLYIIFYTPIALLSKLYNSEQNPDKGMPNLMLFNTNPKMYIPYIVIFSLIVLLFIVGLFKLNNNYYKDNLFIGSWFGMVVFFAVFAFFIFSSYIIQNIINQYYYSDDYSTKDYNANGLSVISEFYQKVFGYGEDQKFDGDDYKYIYLEHLSGISVTLLTMIIVMIIILTIISSSYFNTDSNDENTKMYIFILKNLIIMPSLLLFILLFFIINILEFNRLMNKYVLDEPIKDYKLKIEDLNKRFNVALAQENDKIVETDDEYICRNNRNAILMVLYSHIFNNVQYLSPNGDDDKKKIFIDVIPEFTYDSKCNNNVHVPWFSSNETVYDINYYLNGKAIGTNIFYKFNKCNEVNDCVMNVIERNLLNAVNNTNDSQKLNYNTSNTCKNTKSNLEIIFNDDNLKKSIINLKDNDDLVTNIKSILKNYSKINEFKDNLKLKVYYSLQNVNSDPPLNLTSNLIDISKSSSYIKNNKLVNYYDISPPVSTSIEKYNMYDSIIEKYIDMIYEFIYIHLIHLNYKDKKESYVQKLNVLIKKTFSRINEDLMKSIKLADGKLTNYVINNYNNIHMLDNDKSKIYMKNTFTLSKYNQNKEDNVKWRKENNIKDHYDVVKNLENYANDAKKLYNLVYTGDYEQYKIDKQTFDSNINKFDTFVMKCYAKNLDYNSNIEIINTSNMNFIIIKDSINICDGNVIKNKKLNQESIKDSDKSIYNITYNAYDIITYSSNITYQYSQTKTKDVNTLNDIDKYLEDASKNINMLKQAHLDYRNRNYVETDTFSAKSMNSDDILQKSKEANNLIYFLIINYIITFVMTFLVEKYV